MELLAFVHSSVNYEDPTPDPELTLDIKVPGSAGVALAGVALAVAAVSASPDKASAATPAIAQGSSGDAVTNVQKALGLQADGQFGPRTEASVMDFQIRQGLKQVDGVVGKETATALGLDEKYTPTCFGGGGGGWGDCGWGGYGADYRRIGGFGGYVTVSYIPVVTRYYESYSYDCYDPCDDYYEPRGYDDCYDPCDHYYEPSGWDDCYDPCDNYYEPSGWDDCYQPVSWRPRVIWEPCYEPVAYDPCYDPCDRYYEPHGYYGGGYYGGYEPYYEGYGYGHGGCGDCGCY